MKHNRMYLIYSILFILMVSTQAYAQSSPRLWLGVRAGADIAKLAVDSVEKDIAISSKTGIIAGAEINYWFSDMFGIGAQLDYVQKGTAISDPTDASNTGSINLSYLEIPILLKATFGSGSLKPLVFAGPAIGFKLSANERITTKSRDTTMNIPDSDIVSNNLSIIVGAGVTYSLNQTTMLFLDVAYDYGLTDLNALFGKDQFNTQKLFTRDYRICAGILFGFGN